MLGEEIFTMIWMWLKNDFLPCQSSILELDKNSLFLGHDLEIIASKQGEYFCLRIWLGKYIVNKSPSKENGSFGK